MKARRRGMPRGVTAKPAAVAAPPVLRDEQGRELETMQPKRSLRSRLMVEQERFQERCSAAVAEHAEEHDIAGWAFNVGAMVWFRPKPDTHAAVPVVPTSK